MRRISIVICLITFIFGYINAQVVDDDGNGVGVLDPNYENPIPEIVGVWINESDPKSKWVFTSDDELKSYYDNRLPSTSRFFITRSCGQNSDENAYFMNVIFERGGNHCYEINGVNANNSGILSLTSMENGKIFIYNRQD